MPAIPLPWQILIAVGVIAGITAMLAALARASGRDDTRGQRR